jgi:hypothetical protein
MTDEEYAKRAQAAKDALLAAKNASVSRETDKPHTERDLVLRELGRLHPKRAGDQTARRAALCDTLASAFGLDLRPTDLERLESILDGLDEGKLYDGLEVLRQRMKP